MCTRGSIPSKPADSTDLWKNECINPINTDRNIYTYCDTTFQANPLLNHNCNVDACRLCCATHDQSFKNTSASLNSTQDCFQACDVKFPLHKKRN